MKFINSKLLCFAMIILTIAFTGCEKDQLSDGVSSDQFVGMEPSKNVGVAKDATVTVESKVYASNISGVDRVFALVVDPATTHDPSYYTVPATVTIPAGQSVGTFQVEIIGTNLGDGKKLIVGLEQVLGVDQNVTSVVNDPVPLNSPLGTYPIVNNVVSKTITYTIQETCDLNKVTLSITFDNYPEETAWELYDSSSTVIASGGIEGGVISGYAALGFADQSTFTTSFCLPSGDYTFVIYDDYGDGMFTSTAIQGTYSLKFGETVLASGQGNFGSIADTAFTLP